MKYDYLAKSTPPGYKIGMKTPDIFVAIPKHRWTDDTVRVKHGNTVKTFTKKQIVDERTFPDKYGRGEYTLVYVIWEKKQ